MVVKCDVLVVGAGPAGLTAAALLSKNGYSTIVLENKKTGGPQHTSYDITEGTRIKKILKKIEVKPLKISSKSEWFSPNYQYMLKSTIEDYYFKRGPDKDSLEKSLMKKIQGNNVEFFFRSNISSFRLKGKKVVTVTVDSPHETFTFKPRYIIGADGPTSDLRKKLNVETKMLATFRGFGVLVETKKKEMIPHAKIYFDKKLAPGGYIYSGSVGKDTFYCTVIDDVFFKKTNLAKNLDYFLENRLRKKFTIKNKFNGIGISGIQNSKIGNILFIGGAALFYDPFFGYGLNYAIESAYIAVNAINTDDLQIYTEYTKRIQKELKDIFVSREIWRKADNMFFDKLIEAFKGNYNTKDKQINRILTLFAED